MAESKDVFVYHKLIIEPFQGGVQFDVDLTINGKRTWASYRRNSVPNLYPELQEAIGKSSEEQMRLFTLFFLKEAAENEAICRKWEEEDAQPQRIVDL